MMGRLMPNTVRSRRKLTTHTPTAYVDSPSSNLHLTHTLREWVHHRPPSSSTVFVIILTRLYDLSIGMVAAGIEAGSLKY
jgi:hypothetical protein